MSDHAAYRYSITIHSNDLAVVNCLRALSQFSQKTGNNRITWGGTKGKHRGHDGHNVTFHFFKPAYRDGFLAPLRLSPLDCRRGHYSGD